METPWTKRTCSIPVTFCSEDRAGGIRVTTIGGAASASGPPARASLNSIVTDTGQREQNSISPVNKLTFKKILPKTALQSNLFMALLPSWVADRETILKTLTLSVQ